MYRNSSLIVVAAISLAAAACDIATGPRDDRSRVGIIEWQAASASTLAANATFNARDPYDAPILVAPDTVQAGVPFDVTVTTIGASGCWKADGARVSATAVLAVITPYDLAPTRHANGDPMFCTGALVSLSRPVQLTFAEPGDATIRVEGRVVQDGDIEKTVPGSVEKRVIVR
jgi:hypothetical protein